jgi:maltose O-acetyltransferase
VCALVIRRVLISGIAASWAMPRTLRWAIYRLCGLRFATRAISGGCFFSGPIAIGRGTYINANCFFDGSAPIEVGERCSFGPGVYVITSAHELGGPHQRAGALTARPVRIGAGTWVGARVTILPGVTVGPGCVLAAGAVVTGDCEPNTLYGGVPAKALRRLDA